MKLTSICGLGQFAHSPLTSVLKHFREEVEAHVYAERCPEGVCPMREGDDGGMSDGQVQLTIDGHAGYRARRAPPSSTPRA